MRVTPSRDGLTGLALFTKPAASKGSFAIHCDMHAAPMESPEDVARRYYGMFPNDRIMSMRDDSGRFVPFKPTNREAAAMAAELNRYRKGI